MFHSKHSSFCVVIKSSSQVSQVPRMQRNAQQDLKCGRLLYFATLADQMISLGGISPITPNDIPLTNNHVQHCGHDTSGKILFTTCTSGQVVSPRQSELSSGKCISLVYQERQLSCRVVQCKWTSCLDPTDKVVE